MDDGLSCGTGCGAGLQPVNVSGACKCFHACDPAQPQGCPCVRRCATLVSGDGGVIGGACLAANGPGLRCGLDPMGKPYGQGGCAQGLSCVNEDNAGMFRYCAYNCMAPSDCPTGTSCVSLVDGSGATVGHACALDSGDTGTKGVGEACGSAADVCKTGLLCETTCRTQCDGPGAACTTGTCSALSDGNKILGYVCQ
jgi:hypothetical protein